MHPDDPPRPEALGGAARILSTLDDFERMFREVPSHLNTMLFCQGCVREMGEDVPTAIRRIGAQNKIAAVHFRNLRGTPDKFQEVFVDEGDVDMYQAMQTYREVGFRRSLHDGSHPQLPSRKRPMGRTRFRCRLHPIHDPSSLPVTQTSTCRGRPLRIATLSSYTKRGTKTMMKIGTRISPDWLNRPNDLAFLRQIGVDCVDITLNICPGYSEAGGRANREGLEQVVAAIDKAGLKIERANTANSDCIKTFLGQPGSEEEIDNLIVNAELCGEFDLPVMGIQCFQAGQFGHFPESMHSFIEGQRRI